MKLENKVAFITGGTSKRVLRKKCGAAKIVRSLSPHSANEQPSAAA
jgi:hypothetical protein